MWFHRAIQVFIGEQDFYARQMIAGYLSRDRRTRVAGSASTVPELIARIAAPAAPAPDAILLDESLVREGAALPAAIRVILHHAAGAAVICLTNCPDAQLVLAMQQAGAAACLTRGIVGAGLACAVVYTLQENRFLVTHDVAGAIEIHHGNATYRILPARRQYTRLTPRIEQALWLCVVEGLPADLAAAEMGVSTSTIRSYIKEGYRILEAENDGRFPPSLSPAERAYLCITALEGAAITADSMRQRSAA